MNTLTENTIDSANLKPKIYLHVSVNMPVYLL